MILPQIIARWGINGTPSVPKYKITLVNLGRLRKTIKLHDLPKIPSIT